MTIQKLIGTYTAYNVWAYERTIQWLRLIDKELLYQKVPSSYPSIDSTLQHILRSQKFWLLFITGKDTKFKWAVREGEAETIMVELLTISGEMHKQFSAFSEEELEQVLRLEAPWITNQRPRFEYIMHVINHGTYHRGQIVTMARVLGVTEGILNTDFNFFETP